MTEDRPWTTDGRPTRRLLERSPPPRGVIAGGRPGATCFVDGRPRCLGRGRCCRRVARGVAGGRLLLRRAPLDTGPPDRRRNGCRSSRQKLLSAAVWPDSSRSGGLPSFHTVAKRGRQERPHLGGASLPALTTNPVSKRSTIWDQTLLHRARRRRSDSPRRFGPLSPKSRPSPATRRLFRPAKAPPWSDSGGNLSTLPSLMLGV